MLKIKKMYLEHDQWCADSEDQGLSILEVWRLDTLEGYLLVQYLGQRNGHLSKKKAILAGFKGI